MTNDPTSLPPTLPILPTRARTHTHARAHTPVTISWSLRALVPTHPLSPRFLLLEAALLAELLSRPLLPFQQPLQLCPAARRALLRRLLRPVGVLRGLVRTRVGSVQLYGEKAKTALE